LALKAEGKGTTELLTPIAIQCWRIWQAGNAKWNSWAGSDMTKRRDIQGHYKTNLENFFWSARPILWIP
jgi:hypothetical protein